MDKILEFWGGAERLNRNLERINRFWLGQERIMISINTDVSTYRQLFDFASVKMKLPEHYKAQGSLPGCNGPTFFPDFGTTSLPRYWGGKTIFPTAESRDLFIEPVAFSVEDALKIIPATVNDINMDAVKAITWYEQACSLLNTSYLWLRTPDFQGPLNTAAMIVDQTELMIAMHESPEEVHKLLDRISDFQIDYFKFLQSASDGRIAGNIWPFTFFPAEYGASFTEDIMPLISAADYREFGLPYLEKLSKAFGAVHLHCCGQWGRHCEALVNSQAKIAAIEFHYPFTRFEEIKSLAPAAVLIPYITLDQAGSEFSSLVDYYEYLLRSSDETTRFWFAFYAPSVEAFEFAGKYGFSE